ncbi:ABC transporter ATP-binding protein [Allobaculum mucilyticum]|nr:ABC transporter ATP-binding protein [Allobaculum mucilyticum]UNT97417.1 ABC transporter ATP-binding protein [Allobaculum mucilyticum]
MYEKETLAIVGESGCGKSVTAMSILGLVSEPGEIMPGSKILYTGNDYNLDLATASIDDKRKVRGNEISMIFQEPMTALNPVFTVGDQIEENIRIHEDVSSEECRKRAIELLGKVGISRPEQVIDNYPFQLSGGMCQRVMIAMALSCNPKLLIADEPTTALDVTIQAQILKLMNELKDETGTSIMLITHDLGVVAQVADWVNVMYAGKVVESADVRELFTNPKHPYTLGLMASMPSLAQNGARLNVIEGTVPNPVYLPEGCYFADRCTKCQARCLKGQPPVIEMPNGHTVSCFLYDGNENEELDEADRRTVAEVLAMLNKDSADEAFDDEKTVIIDIDKDQTDGSGGDR